MRWPTLNERTSRKLTLLYYVLTWRLSSDYWVSLCEMLESPQPLELGMVNIPLTAQTTKSFDEVLCTLLFSWKTGNVEHSGFLPTASELISQDPRALRSLCLNTRCFGNVVRNIVLTCNYVVSWGIVFKAAVPWLGGKPGWNLFLFHLGDQFSTQNGSEFMLTIIPSNTPSIVISCDEQFQ